MQLRALITQRTRRAVALVVAVALVSAWAPSLRAEEAQVDRLREMQIAASEKGVAPWGQWGYDPQQFFGWSSHSNRLIPVYTFGMKLDAVRGAKSIYRDAARLEQLFGRMPDHTLNPQAEYFDQTDVYLLQKQAVAAGKKYIILIVFDGMDWDTTRAAAMFTSNRTYDEGRGAGLFFQDYRGAETDFGFYVCTPHSTKAKLDVDRQVVLELEADKFGGFDPKLGGETPWSRDVDQSYLVSQNRERPHAYTDSASSATSLTCGVKTYNAAINFDAQGKQTVPIARELQPQGFKIGVVTSVPVSHATPAAAYSNNVSRNDYQDLGNDLVGEKSAAHPQEPLPGVDVLIGAGWGVTAKTDAGQGQNFLPGNKYLHESTIEKISIEHGGRYRVAQRAAGVSGKDSLLQAAKLAAEKGERFLGYYGVPTGNLPFQTADGRFDPIVVKRITDADTPVQFVFSPQAAYTPADLHENPTLADMTTAALTVLGTGEHFWLMIEPGDVDWANHSNNLDNSIGAVRSGDDAFRAVVKWVEDHHAWDDTAVILTADHGHLFVLKQPEALLAPVTPPAGK